MILTPRKIKFIKIEDIKPNPYQVRRRFDAKKLDALAKSIREIGVLSPIVVRVNSQGYEIVIGERRVRAAQLAGFETIPAVVIYAGDRESALLSMSENIHRENLSYFEEAEGIFNLVSYHKVRKDALAKGLAEENASINNKIKLLSLAPEVRYRCESEKLSETVVRELLKLHDEEKQLELIEKISAENLGKEQTNLLVRNTLREMALQKGKNRRRGKNNCDTSLYANTIKYAVDLLRSGGAKAEMTQKENEDAVEFTIRIPK